MGTVAVILFTIAIIVFVYFLVYGAKVMITGSLQDEPEYDGSDSCYECESSDEYECSDE